MNLEISTMSVARRVIIPKKVLWTCTGNWFRSRFAEAYWKSKGFPSESRGINLAAIPPSVLAPWSYKGEGKISQWTGERLTEMGIYDCAHLERRPLTEKDLENPENAVVALDEVQQRVMMEKKFPRHAHKVTYMAIPDHSPRNTQDFLDMGMELTPQRILDLIQSDLDILHYRHFNGMVPNLISRKK